MVLVCPDGNRFVPGSVGMGMGVYGADGERRRGGFWARAGSRSGWHIGWHWGYGGRFGRKFDQEAR